MATLALSKVFVNLVSTGAAVSGYTARDRGEAYTIPGETRTYAGGRRRSITQAGELGTYTFQLLLVPRTTVETLRTWQGQTVQVRDNKGRRFFGVFYGVTVAEVVSRSAWNATVTLTVTTQAEGV